jgi:hypothetical protein
MAGENQRDDDQPNPDQRAKVSSYYYRVYIPPAKGVAAVVVGRGDATGTSEEAHTKARAEMAEIQKRYAEELRYKCDETRKLSDLD